jgi:hypothetical protein
MELLFVALFAAAAVFIFVRSRRRRSRIANEWWETGHLQRQKTAEMKEGEAAATAATVRVTATTGSDSRSRELIAAS